MNSEDLAGRALREPALLASLPEPLRVSAHSGDGQAREDDDDFDLEYDDREFGCVNCDGGWRHGCCDDMCYGCNEPQWCPDALPCRHCNPHGEIL
jgi:hypothetical protein